MINNQATVDTIMPIEDTEKTYYDTLKELSGKKQHTINNNIVIYENDERLPYNITPNSNSEVDNSQNAEDNPTVILSSTSIVSSTKEIINNKETSHTMIQIQDAEAAYYDKLNELTGMIKYTINDNLVIYKHDNLVCFTNKVEGEVKRLPLTKCVKYIIENRNDIWDITHNGKIITDQIFNWPVTIELQQYYSSMHSK